MENPWTEYVGCLVSIRLVNYHLLGWVGRVSEDPLGNGMAELLDICMVDDTNADGPTKTYPEGTRRKIPWIAVEAGVQRVADIWPEYAKCRELERKMKA